MRLVLNPQCAVKLPLGSFCCHLEINSCHTQATLLVCVLISCMDLLSATVLVILTQVFEWRTEGDKFISRLKHTLQLLSCLNSSLGHLALKKKKRLQVYLLEFFAMVVNQEPSKLKNGRGKKDLIFIFKNLLCSREYSPYWFDPILNWRTATPPKTKVCISISTRIGSYF